MFTYQSRLEGDISWESVADRAKFLGLSIYHKVNLNLTKPAIKLCMPELNNSNNFASGCYRSYLLKVRYFANISFLSFPSFASFPNKIYLFLT